MFNSAGDVIGIVSHNISKSGGSEGLGFLIKSVAKGSPGDEAGLVGGTKVVTVGGEQIVLGGDIILSIEGIPADSAASMMKIRDHLATLKPGAPITATVLRKGRVVDLAGVVP
jgi:serine protease Do